MIQWTNSATLQSAVAATGNGNVFTMNVNKGAILAEVTGTFTATITWEISFDNSNWFGVFALPLTTQTRSLTATTTGLYYIAAPGASFFRARVTWTGGTSVTVKAIGVPLTGSPDFGDAVTLSPGTGASDLGKAEDAAHTSGDVGVAMLAVRRDAAASSSGTDGDYSTINTDNLGNTRTAQALGADAGTSIVSSTAAEASKVIKASAGTLISLVGYNGLASAQFIQIHNTTSVPADTAVPIYSFTVPATSNFSLDIPITGAPFTTGISVCNSTTQATKTLGAANCWFTAVIK